ncbi:MAG: 50S ribosomal protein L35 [Chloroflexi bacterium]|nr:50S ribosomal protein L35 [Chloroflexota bacterium]
MPKLKTHKATAKRFRYTGRGKLRRHKVGKSHLRRKKAKRTLRIFDRLLVVEHKGSIRRVKRLAPYLDKK